MIMIHQHPRPSKSCDLIHRKSTRIYVLIGWWCVGGMISKSQAERRMVWDIYLASNRRIVLSHLISMVTSYPNVFRKVSCNHYLNYTFQGLGCSTMQVEENTLMSYYPIVSVGIGLKRSNNSQVQAHNFMHHAKAWKLKGSQSRPIIKILFYQWKDRKSISLKFDATLALLMKW